MFGMKQHFPTLVNWLVKMIPVPYVPMALMAVPLLAPEHGDANVHIDDSFGSVSMGFKAAPYIANTASSIGKQDDNGICLDQVVF